MNYGVPIIAGEIMVGTSDHLTLTKSIFSTSMSHTDTRRNFPSEGKDTLFSQ